MRAAASRADNSGRLANTAAPASSSDKLNVCDPVPSQMLGSHAGKQVL